MPIRAVMFDIGGILEVIPEGGDPATRFPALDEEWNTRLGCRLGTSRDALKPSRKTGIRALHL